MQIKEFILETRKYGVYTALCNTLLDFTKWFIGAKRLQITYKKGK